MKAIDHSRVNELCCYKFQVSSRATINDLHQIFAEIINTVIGKKIFDFWTWSTFNSNEQFVRFWKLDPEINLKEAYDLLKGILVDAKSYNYEINFKGTYLSNYGDTKIQDLDLGDSDHLVIEARDSHGNWSFFGDNAPKFEKCDGCMRYNLLNVSCPCGKVI